MPSEAEIEKLLPAARHLIAKQYRYIEPAQAGQIARHFKIKPDQMKAAAILADRLRRQQQLSEGRANFRVDGLVDVSAQIDIKPVKRDAKSAAEAMEQVYREYRARKAQRAAATKVAECGEEQIRTWSRPESDPHPCTGGLHQARSAEGLLSPW